MVNARINSQVARGSLRTTPINVRVSKSYSSTDVTGGNITAGMPIGLLLGLTYATSMGGATTTTFSDFQPSVRIK